GMEYRCKTHRPFRQDHFSNPRRVPYNKRSLPGGGTTLAVGSRLNSVGGMMSGTPAKMALEDGTVYTGSSFGPTGETFGEVVFNTSMTGYQEVLTDPSYKGQIVTMTYPLIGNYGINPEDRESRRPQVEGFVVRELTRIPSNFRSQGSLDDYLR